MFPLPGAFLFPNQLLPLHVFEPRYRQMVEDLLDGPGRLVLATIDPACADADEPVPVLPVAGFGELARHEKTADGRFLIWLVGLQRVCIDEAPSDRLYRRVVCRPFAEVAPTKAEAEELRHRLRAAAEDRLQKKLPLPETTPTAVLTDLLVQATRPPADVVAAIFAEPVVADRARAALAAAARFPRGTGND